MANRMTHEAHAHHKLETPPPPTHSGAAISILRITPISDDGIVITSPALDIDGWIDPTHSADQQGPSPELNWNPVEDAGAFALIVEDPDAPREQPFIHWLIWNIEGHAVGLPLGVPNETRLLTPQAAVQGRNDTGAVGWYGPKPPPGHGVHHYHFQLFALDGMLDLDPATTDVRILVDAIKGRTLVSGELVGTFEAPDDSPA